MPNHLSNHCPHRDVECRYHFVGCEFKGPQQEMEVHLRESIDSHLLLTGRNISRIRNDLKNEAKKQQKRQLAEVSRLKELQESQSDVVHMLKKEQERQSGELNELKKQQERHLDELKLQERKLAEANELNRRQMDEFMKQQQQQQTMHEQLTELKSKHGQLERKYQITTGCLVLAIIAFIIAGTVNQMLSITELPTKAEIELAILNHIENVESHCGKIRTVTSNNEEYRDTMNNGRMESSSDLRQQLLPTVTVYSYPELDEDVVLENIPSLTDTDVDVEADGNMERLNSVYTDIDSETAYADEQRNKDTILANDAEMNTNAFPSENLFSNSSAAMESNLVMEEIDLKELHVDLEKTDQLDYQIDKVTHLHVDFHVDLEKNVCNMKDYFVERMLIGSTSNICRVNDNYDYANKRTKSHRNSVVDFSSVESHVYRARDMFINNVERTLSSDDQKMDSDKKVSHTDQVMHCQLKFSHIY